MVGQQWMDSSSCSRWHSNSWKGWFFFKGVYPEQDMHTRSQLQHFTLCCERLTHHNYVEEHNDLADNFDEWRQLREDENPQFKFWSLTLEIQLSVFVFVRSLREGDFHLYIQVLQKIATLMFALDHPNYARWLPMHIRDIMLLEECHPDVAAEFKKGNFCS